MAKEDKKIIFRDLSWVLKLAAIGGFAYLIIFVFSLIYSLMGGGL
jgi:hypothetical protein